MGGGAVKTEEIAVKIVLRDRLAESFKRYLAAEPRPGLATSSALCEVSRLMQKVRQEQEVALMKLVETEYYAERVRVEAEAYGISEESIRRMDAVGIPWRSVCR
jgi:hypothetical protein